MRFLTVTGPMSIGMKRCGNAVTCGLRCKIGGGVSVSPPTWFDGLVPPETERLVSLLHQAWQGEWYGVRIYGELAAARADPIETATMLELVVLETYVLGELTVALFSLGVEPDPGPMEAEADVDLAEHVNDEWLT